MNPQDLKQILSALIEADVREFSLSTSSFSMDLKRGPQQFASVSAPSSFTQFVPSQAPVMLPPPVVELEAAPVIAAPPAEQTSQSAPPAPAKGTPLKAPIVGTFYASSSPDAQPYVKIGDTVKAGQILCIIEAMKLMNEIEAESDGVIQDILVKNADPVEYGQTLFIIG